MNRVLLWKAMAIVAITAVAILYLAPSAIKPDDQPEWMQQYFKKRIQPGLDLQGGLHLVYEIDVEKAVSDKADKLAGEIERRIEKDLKLEGAIVKREGFDRIFIKTKVPGDIAKLDNDFFLSNRAQLTAPDRDEAAGTIRIGIDEEYAASIHDSAIRQAIETLRGRVDSLGVAEPTIITKGTGIVIELPGLKQADFARIKRLIGKTAQLEFKLAADKDKYLSSIESLIPKDKGLKLQTTNWTGKNTGAAKTMDYIVGPDKKALQDFFKSLPADKRPPPELEIGYEETEARGEDAGANQTVWWAYMLKRRAIITGEYLADTDWSWDRQTGQPEVLFTWDREGTRIFSKASGDNIDAKMAILLDGKITSAPVIESKIGQNGRITLGSYGDPMKRLQEAKDLDAVLKTGALPAPLTKIFETQIGPTLGADVVKSAKMAIGLGGLMVIALMLFYYKVSGLIAIFALTLNMIYMLAVLAGFEASLTLPGIAGLGLTIGMAVDANIIIYERIREEIRGGRSPRSAVDAGFDHAFWAVFDAQVTTLVAAIVLYSYGSGPIKGFAVTLWVGIMANLFTALFVSRTILTMMVNRKRPVETLSL